jgi:hypothetical protein
MTGDFGTSLARQLPFKERCHYSLENWTEGIEYTLEFLPVMKYLLKFTRWLIHQHSKRQLF